MQQSCGDAGKAERRVNQQTNKQTADLLTAMGKKRAKKKRCRHTLSKREIFMAFIVAESTSIGGPSSNTSLMNSLPLLGKIREEHENTWIRIITERQTSTVHLRQVAVL